MAIATSSLYSNGSTSELLRRQTSSDTGITTFRHRRQAAKKAGLTDEQLDAIDDYQHGPFSDSEKTVISYSEQLTTTANVDDATAEVLKKDLSDKQLVTLAATIALANFTNRFNHV